MAEFLRRVVWCSEEDMRQNLADIGVLLREKDPEAWENLRGLQKPYVLPAVFVYGCMVPEWDKWGLLSQGMRNSVIDACKKRFFNLARRETVTINGRMEYVIGSMLDYAVNIVMLLEMCYNLETRDLERYAQKRLFCTGV